MSTPSLDRWPSEADLPDRLTYLPFTDGRLGLGIDYIELVSDGAGWIEQIMEIAEASDCQISRAKMLAIIPAGGYTVRVAVRSGRSIVGLVVGKHFAVPDETGQTANRILLLWVHPDYWNTKVPLALVQQARLELPEYPTICEVGKGDTDLKNFLLRRGWTEYSDDPDRTRYAIAGPARLEYRAFVEKNRPARPHSADD